MRAQESPATPTGWRLRDIRDLRTGLDDLRVELTLTARYTVGELGREQELLRVLATESRTHPNSSTTPPSRSSARFSGASTLARHPRRHPQRATAVAAVGFGALLSNRVRQALFGIRPTDIPDEAFIATWAQMMEHTIAHEADRYTPAQTTNKPTLGVTR